MKWIANLYDPAQREMGTPDVPPEHTIQIADEDREAYLAGKIIGEPQPLGGQTVAELKQAGVVGVYIAYQSG